MKPMKNTDPTSTTADDSGGLSPYIVYADEGGELRLEAHSLDEAREIAEKWVRGVDWDTSEGTVWQDVSIYEYDDDGDRCGSASAHLTITINPPEPKCGHHDGHDWQSPHGLLGGLEENPGVSGHGGGVVCNEVCMRCGVSRTTDTWTQRPDTGEEGFLSVSYDVEAEDISTLWTDLEDLLEAIRGGHQGTYHPVYSRQMSTEMPTYGGTEPEDTQGVWSWDATRRLVGDTIADLEIVDRTDGEGR